MPSCRGIVYSIHKLDALPMLQNKWESTMELEKKNNKCENME